MNWEAISAIAEISGLIIIVVSLLFISSQTKQANDHASASSEIAFTEGIDKIFNSWASDEHTSDVIRRGFSSFNGLNDNEKVLFQMRVGSIVNQLNLAQQLSEKNLLSKELANEVEKVTISILSTDGGLEYWEHDSKVTPGGEELLAKVREAKGKIPNFTDLVPWWKISQI